MRFPHICGLLAANSGPKLLKNRIKTGFFTATKSLPPLRKNYPLQYTLQTLLKSSRALLQNIFATSNLPLNPSTKNPTQKLDSRPATQAASQLCASKKIDKKPHHTRTTQPTQVKVQKGVQTESWRIIIMNRSYTDQQRREALQAHRLHPRILQNHAQHPAKRKRAPAGPKAKLTPLLIARN
ncbi:MAG: hypothetical protein Q4C71_00315 [Microbacteriaceae bacterium]|nr:hypothetical protein [Microbacteriaceae bacterium]